MSDYDDEWAHSRFDFFGGTWHERESCEYDENGDPIEPPTDDAGEGTL